ncbi:MAG: CBS domain-containing protein [Sphingomonadales bacterium]
MLVKSILKAKGSEVFSVDPDDTVQSALRSFNEWKVGFAIVGKLDGKVLGTVSERDICHAMAEFGDKAASMAVREVMTRNVVSCAAEDALPKVMALMTASRTRHVLVMENGAIKGIISIGDLVKHRLDEMLRQEESMLDYIAGTGYSFHI